jgi:hypothetical protein
MSASCQVSPALMGRQPVRASNFHAAFEVVALAREIDEDQVFATLDTPTNDVLNANDLRFDDEAGLRVTVGAKVTQRYAVEISFMTMNDWDDSLAVSDATRNLGGTEGNLFSPFTNFGSPAEVGLDFNNFASLRLMSGVDTLEWNLRQRLPALETPYFSATAIYGFRYLAFDELLQYRTESNLPFPGGTVNALDVVMNNHLYGFQLGGTVDFRVAPFWVNLEGKAAVCHNSIFEDVNFAGSGGGNPPSEPIDLTREDGATAFVGHVVAAVELRFAPNWVGRIGYQALFVDGLALATRSEPAELLHDASAVFHGPVAGIVVTW